MSKNIRVIFGSSTGNTERAAGRIALKLGGTAVNVAQAGATSTPTC